MAAARSTPKIFTGNRQVDQFQTNVVGPLNVILNNPLINGQTLISVSLASGANVITHGLGRKLQGWFVVRQRAVISQFFDTQDLNPQPAATLQLNASVAVVVDLFVY